jgi:hypothetical protein
MGLKSITHLDFWKCYEKLPQEVKGLADRKFFLFRSQPFHPSLGFSKNGLGDDIVDGANVQNGIDIVL